MESRFKNKRVLLRDTFDCWYDGTIVSAFEEMGQFFYKIKTIDGKIHRIPCADISYIGVPANKKARVLPFKKKLSLVK